MKALRPSFWVLAALGLLAVACGDPLVAVSGAASGSDDAGDATTRPQTTSTATSGTTLSPTSSSSSTAPTGESTSQSTTRGSSGTSTAATETSETSGPLPGFLVEPDGGGANIECSVWDQDCPPGEKCMPWANDGGNSWNATRCTPLAPDPDGPGEPCTVEESRVSGIDSCEAAAMCWGVDRKTLDGGECVPFCIGSESTPQCADPSRLCSITAEGVTNLCLPMCDPLQQDCGAERSCVSIGDAFVCAPDASGDAGAAGDPCEYVNACDPGMVCMNAALLPECTGAGACCTPFCDLSDPVCPGKGETCIPYFDPGQAPPGGENVGFCEQPMK